MAATTTTKRRPLKVGKVDMKTVLSVVICLILSAATYFLFTSPQRHDAAVAKTEAQAAQAELESNNQKITDINTGKQSGAAELLVQAQDLDRKLPADVDKIALVSNVSALASQYGVTVGQMDPVAGTDAPAGAGGGNTKSQSFTVAATGTTDGLAAMLGALKDYPATVTVSNLTINTAAGATATAQFTLKAFYVPSAVVKPH